MKHAVWVVLLLALQLNAEIFEGGVLMMPTNCAELLPDAGPYLQFLEATANAVVQKDRRLSRRIFRIFKLREQLAEENDWIRGQNPIDGVIRKTICFYREQKEPIRAIAFDDKAFTQFLTGAIGDLEKKVDEILLQVSFERQQRKEFERRFQANRHVIESVQQEAARDAAQTLERINSVAKKKVGK